MSIIQTNTKIELIGYLHSDIVYSDNESCNWTELFWGVIDKQICSHVKILYNYKETQKI